MTPPTVPMPTAPALARHLEKSLEVLAQSILLEDETPELILGVLEHVRLFLGECLLRSVRQIEADFFNPTRSIAYARNVYLIRRVAVQLLDSQIFESLLRRERADLGEMLEEIDCASLAANAMVVSHLVREDVFAGASLPEAYAHTVYECLSRLDTWLARLLQQC